MTDNCNFVYSLKLLNLKVETYLSSWFWSYILQLFLLILCHRIEWKALKLTSHCFLAIVILLQLRSRNTCTLFAKKHVLFGITTILGEILKLESTNYIFLYIAYDATTLRARLVCAPQIYHNECSGFIRRRSLSSQPRNVPTEHLPAFLCFFFSLRCSLFSLGV